MSRKEHKELIKLHDVKVSATDYDLVVYNESPVSYHAALFQGFEDQANTFPVAWQLSRNKVQGSTMAEFTVPVQYGVYFTEVVVKAGVVISTHLGVDADLGDTFTMGKDGSDVMRLTLKSKNPLLGSITVIADETVDLGEYSAGLTNNGLPFVATPINPSVTISWIPHEIFYVGLQDQIPGTVVDTSIWSTTCKIAYPMTGETYCQAIFTNKWGAPVYSRNPIPPPSQAIQNNQSFTITVNSLKPMKKLKIVTDIDY